MMVISWNCRGMGSKVKEEAMRSLIRTETPDILLVQETKLEDIVFLQASKKLWFKSEARAISAGAPWEGLVLYGTPTNLQSSLRRAILIGCC